MKIQDPNLTNNLAGVNVTSTLKTTSAEKVGGAGRTNGSSAAGVGSDEVSLSGLAKQIEGLQSDSPERLAKVARLEADVQSGTYRVDAGATARGIVEDAFGREE